VIRRLRSGAADDAILSATRYDAYGQDADA
jgi:hypothetical protein